MPEQTGDTREVESGEETQSTKKYGDFGKDFWTAVAVGFGGGALFLYLLSHLVNLFR